MKIAFVYDRVNKIGGAERVLLAVHEMWPDAPLYTAVYDPKKAPWASVFTVYTTFLQRIPFAKRFHEWFAWLTPFAFGSLSFDDYDVVLSITSAEAKGIITKPNTLHICYCLTPTRYLWSGSDIYQKQTGFGIFHLLAKTVFSSLITTLRSWDCVASQRPDRFVAISHHVEERIRRYYQRKVAHVIYPPVDTKTFTPSILPIKNKSYYLLVSRLVPYKRADIVVQACTELERNLIVIGEGSDRKRLEALAGPTITFVPTHLTDHALLGYYQQCRAFLFAGDEDFGIVAGEAQSIGIPVIAYRESGIAEIVRDGKTGILFDTQSVDGLKKAIKQFETITFDKGEIRKNAERFDTGVFQKNIKEYIEKEFKRF